MTNSRWLSLLRRRADRSRKKEREEGSFCSTPNVNREYKEALRTRSYVEIWKKAHVELKNASTRRLSSNNMHFTEYLLEPRQEIIANMKVHRLLVEYFETSFEACRCCDTILQAFHQTRLSYAKVTRVIKLSQTLPYDQSQKPIYAELSSFLSQNNPLSAVISRVQFRDMHDRYMSLLRGLISKKGKIKRTLTIKRVCKKVGAIGLIVSQSVLLVVLLVFAFVSVIGLMAVPWIGNLFGSVIKKRSTLKTKSCMRLCEQLDVAAKGVYVMMNELDTMSRMVKRLDDEVEHCREVADICVKNYKCEILKWVVKEFQDDESNVLDMFDELEEHIYLCFLTINRFRRLVMQEITEKQS